jgi:hypothetical protein
MKLLIIFSILCYLTLSSLSTNSLRKHRKSRGSFNVLIKKFTAIALAQSLTLDIVQRYLLDYNGSLTLTIEGNKLKSIKINKDGELDKDITVSSYIRYEIVYFPDPLIISLQVNYYNYIFQIQAYDYENFNSNIRPQLDGLQRFTNQKLIYDLTHIYKGTYEQILKMPVIPEVYVNKKGIQASLGWTNTLIEYLKTLL